MIYDGNCAFCRRWIARWQRLTAGRVDYAPSAEAGPRFPEIPAERFVEAVQLVEPDGRVSAGAEAAARSLDGVPHLRWLLALYRHLPGAAPLAAALYRFIARRRGCLSACG
jgi:lipase maturation factor 1